LFLKGFYHVQLSDKVKVNKKFDLFQDADMISQAANRRVPTENRSSTQRIFRQHPEPEKNFP